MAVACDFISNAAAAGNTFVDAGVHPVSGGDILLLLVESSNSTTAAGTPTTPSGFTKIFEQTQGSGATGVTTLTIFAKVAVGTEDTINVVGAANHHCASLYWVSGAVQDVSQIIVGTGNAGSGTTLTALGITTSVNDCGIAMCMATTRDAIANNFTSYSAGSGITGLTERFDTGSNVGAGGGTSLGFGTITTATTTGNTTVAHAVAENWIGVMLGFKPYVAPASTGTPVDASRVYTKGSTAADPCIINLPSVVNAGETLLMCFRESNGANITTPTGWTALFNSGFTGTESNDDGMLIAWRKADGSESGGTVSVDLSFGAALHSAVVWKVFDAADPTINPPEISSHVFSTGSTTPDPGTITPSGGSGNYLVYWLGGWSGEQISPPATPPSGYSNWIGADSGVGGAAATNCRVAGGSKQIVGASEDPPSVTLDSSGGWSAFAVAFYPAGAPVYLDSATVLVDLQASGSELAETVDSATAPLLLSVSSTEVHEIPDAATVLVDLQASGTEFTAKDYTDSATALIDLDASGTEFITHEYTDAATVLVDLQASGSDLYVPPVQANPNVIRPIIVGGQVYQDRSRW